MLKINTQLMVNKLKPIILKPHKNGKYKDLFKFKCSDFYWALLEKKVTKSYAPLIWENICQEKINWKKLWKMKVKNTKPRKIAQFNYILLYNKLPHKYNLFKWKISDTSLCNSCQVRDDCKHFLFECVDVVPFWRQFNIAVNKIFKINIVLNWSNIIVGYQISNQCFMIMNVLIIVATFAVYKARCTDMKLLSKYLIEELSILKILYKEQRKVIVEFIHVM